MNYIVQNMASEIFVHACHILKRTETCLVTSQSIYYTVKKSKSIKIIGSSLVSHFGADGSILGPWLTDYYKRTID